MRLLVSLFLLLPVIASAADFWTVKKFSEWSEKEAQKMVKDSPWAMPVEIQMGGGGTGGGGRGRRGGGGGMGGGTPDASVGSSGDEGGGGGGKGGNIGDMVRPTTQVILRWHSALPMKQAVAVIRYGAEAGTSPDAKKMLERVETHYVLGIAGLPPQMARMNPEALKSGVALKRKGKEPIAPQDIKADRDQATGKLNLYVFFPRGGASEITAEDRDVEVTVKAGALDFKRKFNLKKMVYEGKLEI